MALSIVSSPQFPISCSRNPVIFQFLTDNSMVNAGTKAAAGILFATAALSGQVFFFNWPGTSLRFQAIEPQNMNDSGLRFQAGQGAQSMSAYVDLVIQQISRNYTLHNAYEITKFSSGSNFGVLFTARQPGTAFAITIDSTAWTATNVTVPVDTEARPNFKIKADLYKYNGFTKELVASEDQYPDKDNIATFDFSSTVDLYCEAANPVGLDSTGTSTNTTLVQKFEVRYYEVFGDPPVVQGAYLTPPFWAFEAGVAIQDFPDNAFLTALVSGSPKPFLTNAPKRKMISRQQLRIEYLYSLLTTTATVAPVATVYYSNDATSVWTGTQFGGVEYGNYATSLYDVLLHIIANESPTKKAVKFTFKTTTSGGAVDSEERTYIIDDRYCQFEKFIVFQNSLGGFDTLRCYGDITNRIDPKSEIAESILPLGYTTFDAQLRKHQVSYTESLKLQTGYYPKEYIRYLSRELPLSLEAFVVHNEKLIPAIIKTKSDDYLKENAGLFSQDLEIQFAFVNNSYSL